MSANSAKSSASPVTAQRKRNAHVYRTVKNKTPVSMAEGVLNFCIEYPECEKPKFQPLYIAALTIAYLIDQHPNGGLIREFSIANSKLRREILAQYKDDDAGIGGMV
jgi:hypothetical protein